MIKIAISITANQSAPYLKALKKRKKKKKDAQYGDEVKNRRKMLSKEKPL